MEQSDSIQEMQILEQNLHSILLQKQAFQLELSETEASVEEINKSDDEVFKIVGNLMIKTSKDKILDELNNKKKLLSIRVNSLDKQEEAINSKVSKIRDSVLGEKKK